MKNWKTTAAGAVGGIPMIIEGIITKNWTMLASGVCSVILGLCAKDSNVTGGTVQQF